MLGYLVKRSGDLRNFWCKFDYMPIRKWKPVDIEATFYCVKRNSKLESFSFRFLFGTGIAGRVRIRAVLLN
ncbi:MAG TPA: hypothetical protein DIT28_20680 [Oxalobacteraceae bacterium]|nr:hypothetical protein [Oxalobacteraceae bacterium]